MSAISDGQIWLWEIIGTAVLILLGAGVVAGNNLVKSGFHNSGGLFINFGWGLAVFAGASIAWQSGAHLNPAVTLGLAIADKTPWSQVPIYICAQMIGAFIGAMLCYAAYKKNFDADPHPENTRGIFCTGPQVKNYFWNTVTEVIGTFVLVFWILRSPAISQNGGTLDLGNSGLGYAGVAFVVLVIGNSLGGPTGYAINPARDLAPRIAYALMPIKGKGSLEWNYAWVPVVGPIIGGALAGGLFLLTQNV